jgi:hypothetical protein
VSENAIVIFEEHFTTEREEYDIQNVLSSDGESYTW